MIVSITRDPTGHFERTYGDTVTTMQGKIATKEWCLVVAGMIPVWVEQSPDASEPLIEVFRRHYQFGLIAMDGNIDEDGIYRFPEDPPLFPTLLIKREVEDLYCYEHAIFAVRNREHGSYYITRMD